MKPGMIKEFAALIRLEYLGFSCVCVIGALSVAGRQLTIGDAAVLFLIHMFSIIWGFVHNDYCDVEYDKFAISIKERPLINGIVSYKSALWIIYCCIFLAFSLVAFFYFRPLPVTLFILSIPLAALYNYLGKRIKASDILFALSASFLCLFGAVAVSEGTHALVEINFLTWIIVAIQFVDHLFFNITGSIKDVEVDRKAGAMTTPIALGVKVRNDRTLIMPAGFRTLLMVLKVATLVLVFLPFLSADYPSSPSQILLLSVVATLSLYATWQIAHIKVFNRRELASLVIRQENFCKALVPLMLIGYIGIYWFLFFLIPPIWFIVFNTYINGSTFQPPKTY